MNDDETTPGRDQDPTNGWTMSPSLARDGQWSDRDGTAWRLRGDGRRPITTRRVEQLLSSPRVRVLHFYLEVMSTEVGPDDREAMWERIRPYLKNTRPREAGDFTDFTFAELKDDQRRSMLIIRESC